MNRVLLLVFCVVLPSTGYSSDASSVEAHELVYKEVEESVGAYFVRLTVTDAHLRIDDLSDDSGYIIYDHDSRTIYSVSNFDQSVLVIENNEAKRPEQEHEMLVSDIVLGDAPKISGKDVHDYRVSFKGGEGDTLCTHIQYVPGLLMEVGKVLQAYQEVVSGNQLRTLDQIPEEFRSPCMLSDKIFNRGEYYLKGLVISEWHDAGKQRLLQDFKTVQADKSLFELPSDYRQFSLP